MHNFYELYNFTLKSSERCGARSYHSCRLREYYVTKILVHTFPNISSTGRGGTIVSIFHYKKL